MKMLVNKVIFTASCLTLFHCDTAIARIQRRNVNINNARVNNGRFGMLRLCNGIFVEANNHGGIKIPRLYTEPQNNSGLVNGKNLNEFNFDYINDPIVNNRYYLQTDNSAGEPLTLVSDVLPKVVLSNGIKDIDKYTDSNTNLVRLYGHMGESNWILGEDLLNKAVSEENSISFKGATRLVGEPNNTAGDFGSRLLNFEFSGLTDDVVVNFWYLQENDGLGNVNTYVSSRRPMVILSNGTYDVDKYNDVAGNEVFLHHFGAGNWYRGDITSYQKKRSNN